MSNEDGTVWVVFNGETVAESDGAMILHETRLAPVFYFPRADVRIDLLEPTTHHNGEHDEQAKDHEHEEKHQEKENHNEH